MELLLVVAAVVGYLAGSISFTRLVGRAILPGQDLSVTEMPDLGDGQITLRGVSPNSIRQRAGPAAGCATALLEIAKSLVPTLVVRLAFPDTPAAAVCASAAVAGHVFPVWHGFRGGFGMSPMVGGLLVLDPPAAIVLPIVGLAIGLALADTLLAFDAWPLLMLPWALVRGEPDLLLFAVVSNAVFWWADRDKVRQHLALRRADRRPWRVRLASIVAVMRGRG